MVFFASALLGSAALAQDAQCAAAGGNVCVSDPLACVGVIPEGGHAGCPFCCRSGNRSRPIGGTPGRLAPLVVHYGFIQADGGGIDEELNQTLITNVTNHAEVVFASFNWQAFEYGHYQHPEDGNWLSGSDWDYDESAPHTPAFTAWRDRAKLAKRVKDEQLKAWLASGTPPEEIAERIARYFRFGWDYVFVDELNVGDFGDRTERGPENLRKLRAVLETLADLGFDRRFIIFLNPYTVSVARRPNSVGRIGGIRGLMRTCARRCRALLFESYPEAGRTRRCRRCIKTSTVTGRRRTARYLGWLARRIQRAARGRRRAIMSITGPVLGTSNRVSLEGGSLRYLNVERCDLSPLAGRCPRRRRGMLGGLHAQLRQLNRRGPARRMRVLGFYNLSKVDETGTYTRRDYALAARRWSARWARLHR
jgi:hypothetical protein